MTEYSGRTEGRLGARAGRDRAPRGVRANGREARVGRSRRVRQRDADERRRDLRRAPRRAQSRRADRSAGAHRQSPLRVGHPGRGQRRADDSARRSGHRARRRHREHEPGAARDSRPAHRACKLNQGKLEDSLYEALLDPYCGLFMAQTAEKCAAKYNISREEQDAYALRSQQAASQGVGRRQVQRRSHAGRNQIAQGRDGRRQGRSPAAGHDARGPGEVAGGVLEGRQRSPPATPAASSTAARR